MTNEDSEDSGVRQEQSRDVSQMRHLTGEVERIAAEAGIGARRAQRRGKLWNATHLLLGFPAAVLAAVSGAAGLASSDARVPAAILALLAAGFSAGATFLRAEARQLANLRRRYAWQDLEVRARLVLGREAYMTHEDLYNALSRLLELRRAVPSSAIVLSELPTPPSLAQPLQNG
ncbi:hypothetical protein [Streptomyces odonnellii]|uniref:hypothetical protein n=1 Tax=Streptomyces odonnellii TaxID=1417980 RepID=UPI000A839189|nr:hypothetical protein [Streptomyces odonnellii]